jgi:fructose-bisphosphate aldolase class II
MSLVLRRDQVLEAYAEAADRKWVLPAFNAENLTTIEAILQAACEYGDIIGIQDLPIIVGITNNYESRPQSVYYTHTRQWNTGLRLFLADLNVLTSEESPYSKLKVMIHLDHIQWDEDHELLEWDMNQFSSIMYDASTLSFKQNIEHTADFKEKYGDVILIEGACDEIYEYGSVNNNNLTTPDMAERYFRETGVDIIVVNLGTEHRATAANLQYHSELACEISKRIGPCLCLHGTSSVPLEKLSHLFDDGVRRVNIWTALERDSSSHLFQDMLNNTAKIIGPDKAKALLNNHLLGKSVDLESVQSLDYFTTSYRQNIIYQNMKKIVSNYLEMFYKRG